MNRTTEFIPFASLCVICVFAAPSLAENKITVRSRDKLVAALHSARPGDTILVEPGTYQGGLDCDNLQGTAEQPIVVSGFDPQNPPVIEGGASGIHLRDPAHLVISNIRFTGASGNGVNIDDGGTFDTPAKNITLQGVTVDNIGPSGNCDGIKLSGVDGLVIEDCRFNQWGASGSAIDMVGCHNGRIARCTFQDARGDNANGVQAKGGSTKITVSGCRFENAGGRAVNVGGSTGKDYFRPAESSAEAKGIVVEDCIFSGSAAPVSFVGVDGADFRFNTIYRPTRWIARILQENQDSSLAPCRNVRFENNLVAFHSSQLREAINIGPKTAPETFSFRNNVWHCLDRPENTRRFVKLPVSEEGGRYDATPTFRDAEQGDYRLAEDSPIKDVGARAE